MTTMTDVPSARLLPCRSRRRLLSRADRGCLVLRCLLLCRRWHGPLTLGGILSLQAEKGVQKKTSLSYIYILKQPYCIRGQRPVGPIDLRKFLGKASFAFAHERLKVGGFLPYIVLRGQVFAHEQCYRFLFVGKAKLELEALNLCHRPSEICGQRQVLPFVGMGRVFAHQPLGFRI